MPSHRANHFGSICEQRAMEQYGLEADRDSWRDARLSSGTPVEIKSTAYEHADGQPGNFKVYEAYHRKLRRHDGRYVFVVYTPTKRGLRVRRMTMIHSSQLPRLSWHGGGEHRETRQAKIGIGEVF